MLTFLGGCLVAKLCPTLRDPMDQLARLTYLIIQKVQSLGGTRNKKQENIRLSYVMVGARQIGSPESATSYGFPLTAPASTGLPCAARDSWTGCWCGTPGESHSPGSSWTTPPQTGLPRECLSALDPALPQADLHLLSLAPERACHLCPQAGDTGPPACQQACLPACLTLSISSKD